MCPCRLGVVVVKLRRDIAVAHGATRGVILDRHCAPYPDVPNAVWNCMRHGCICRQAAAGKLAKLAVTVLEADIWI